MLDTHGGHHVAQNSTTYAVPVSSLRTRSPFTHASTEIFGAADPTLRSAACAAVVKKIDVTARAAWRIEVRSMNAE